jgi:hypothetical protein
MFNINTFVRHGVLALSLGCAALAAQAAPTTYHIAVDTAAYGANGSLDTTVGSTNSAALLLASMANYSAGFNGVDPLYSGAYQTTATGYALTNGSGYNYLSQLVSFGSILSFDVTFSGSYFDVAGTEATGFDVALYDAAGSFLGDVVRFNFATTGTDRITYVNGLGNATLVDANAVPEPTQLVLMLTALAMMGVMVKRRQG